MGIIHGTEMRADKLHNHPSHAATKIPSKVDTDIRQAVISNSHLKTRDIMISKNRMKHKMGCNLHKLCLPVLPLYLYFNPVHLYTPYHLWLGKGINYMPGSATHHGKIKNIRLSTLRDTQMTQDPKSCILIFEKETAAHDAATTKETQCKGNHSCM